MKYFDALEKLLPWSGCQRRRVAAMIINPKTRRPIGSGVNGSPHSSCEKLGGCLRNQMGIESGTRHEVCRAVHAEQEAIFQAMKHGNGKELEGAVLICTHSPCSICARMIIRAGIKAVYYKEGYPDEIGFRLLEEAGVTCEQRVF